jgi:hypothetical protein
VEQWLAAACRAAKIVDGVLDDAGVVVTSLQTEA